MQQGNKTTAAVLAGAIVTVGVWLLREFAGVELPGEVQGAVQTIIVGGLVWAVANKESANA